MLEKVKRGPRQSLGPSTVADRDPVAAAFITLLTRVELQCGIVTPPPPDQRFVRSVTQRDLKHLLQPNPQHDLACQRVVITSDERIKYFFTDGEIEAITPGPNMNQCYVKCVPGSATFLASVNTNPAYRFLLARQIYTTDMSFDWLEPFGDIYQRFLTQTRPVLLAR